MSDPQQLEGTVTKIEASSSWVDAGAAGRFRCDLRAKITRHSNQRLAVGDRVVFTPTPAPGAGADAPPTTDATAEPRGGVIEKILPRKSALMRPRSYKRDQILCANMDQVLVVISVYEPPYKRNFVDRLLVGVEREGLSPVLVFNKLDLADAEYRSVCADDAKVYRGLGYGVVGTSVPTGEGIEDLRAIMKDRISAVAAPRIWPARRSSSRAPPGSSVSVWKSTFTNCASARLASATVYSGSAGLCLL